jgi:hypothetical protein
MTVENEILITAIFGNGTEGEVEKNEVLCVAGALAYVIIPGLLVIWDRVLDYMAGY